MQCYITRTASYLPGPVIENNDIERFLGSLNGEHEVREAVLKMNGIERRHYAQDESQRATHDVYDLGVRAAMSCLAGISEPVTYLGAGTTYSPLAAPGCASIMHERLREVGLINHPVEISSHAGICSSASTAMIGAIRAIAGGHHDLALCIGTEHAWEVLKSTAIKPVDDRDQHSNLRNSQWFMSVFLRFMLSDGGGVVLLRNRPQATGLSWQVNWTHSMSFANESPLCMKLDNSNALLTQDLNVLNRNLIPCSRKFVSNALETHRDDLDSYTMILPHMSSFYFRRKMERVIGEHCRNPMNPTPYWTNLATAGNTGAASIYIMLDEYIRRHVVNDGERLLLFVPESGQFNFVMISLTAVVR